MVGMLCTALAGCGVSAQNAPCDDYSTFRFDACAYEYDARGCHVASWCRDEPPTTVPGAEVGT
jgi:hypothetical protein